MPLIDKRVNVSTYGLSLFSVEQLSSFMKDNKISRTKRLLERFQKDHPLYLKSIETGSWLPIPSLDSVEYIISVNEPFKENWLKIRTEKRFNLTIGHDEKLWITCIGSLFQWDVKNYTNDFISYQMANGKVCCNAVSLPVKKGKYHIDIECYIRTSKVKYPDTNYAFNFNLTPIDDFDGYLDPREDEKYLFNHREIIENQS